MRSVRGSGCQVAISASTKLHCGSRWRAFFSMSGEESNPTMSDCGKRSTNSSVELPGPQPRSTMSRGRCSGTCATRSRGGRVRSSSNLRYCVALQSSIACRLDFDSEGEFIAPQAGRCLHDLAATETHDQGVYS